MTKSKRKQIKPSPLIYRAIENTQYEFVSVLGEGTYGQVFSAQNRHTGEKVAVKVAFPMDNDEGVGCFVSL